MKMADLVAGPAVACRPDVSLVELAQTMVDEGVGSMAVVDGERLVGIVTDRDIVEAVARSESTVLTAGEVMTEGPDTIDVEVDVQEATEWLNATGYRHLPVTDEGKLLGIVSIKDLLWALTEE